MREDQKVRAARRLRRDMTDAERLLWRCMRCRQLAGFKIRRQHPIGPYVVDFACVQLRLGIEVDGGQHAGSLADIARDAYLRRCGFEVLRFWNNDVLANIEGVCEVILQRLLEVSPRLGSGPRPEVACFTACPHPSLPPRAEEGDKPLHPHAGAGDEPPLPPAGEGWGEGRGC